MKVELGVVEDRHDPEQMGRVRVRIIGKHSDNLSDIPTSSLPWATVMLPTTSPSVSGLGHTQFLVEGSWVVVAFNDQFMQDPIVLGSISSMSEIEGKNVDITKGFGDLRPIGEPTEETPNAVPESSKFPRYTNEPDYNRLGRGLYASKHWSTKKRLERAASLNEGGVPIATRPDMDSVGGSSKEERSFWKEPTPGASGGFSQYPYNHVFESEAGHVIEVDDTPKAARLMTQHNSGTFEEIHPDGTKVTKILKDSYEIILGDNSIYINGDCNMTVNGSMKTLIKKDYTLEVEGTYYEKVNTNKSTKIGATGRGNYSFEILGNQTGIVNKANTLNTSDSTFTTRGSHSHVCSKGYNVTTLLGNVSIFSVLSINIDSLISTKITSGVSTAVKSLGKTYINAGAMVNMTCDIGLINIYAATSVSATAGGALTCAAGGVLTTLSVGASSHTAGGVMNVSSMGATNVSAMGLLNLSSNVVIRGSAPVILLN